VNCSRFSWSESRGEEGNGPAERVRRKAVRLLSPVVGQRPVELSWRSMVKNARMASIISRHG
jgi:hypothetical protein